MLDGGYVDADLLVRGPDTRSRLIGPLFGSYSRQWREGKGDNLQAFVIDWQAGRRAVPQGYRQHSLATWARCVGGSHHSHPV